VIGCNDGTEWHNKIRLLGLESGIETRSSHLSVVPSYMSKLDGRLGTTECVCLQLSRNQTHDLRTTRVILTA
jgi:hypothetical protein